MAAEAKLSELAAALDLTVNPATVAERVHFALFRAGYDAREFTPIALPGGWHEVDGIDALKERRTTRSAPRDPFVRIDARPELPVGPPA